MKDVFEAAGEWEFLADSYFDQWRRSRADGALLFKSGYFLEKAGDLDQGLHRQRAANLVPLGHPWTRSGLRYNQEKYGAEKMAENQRAVIRHVGNGTDGDYTNLQREQFHRLRRAGDPRRAALLWSSAHYHMLRANTGIVYGNNFYALNNGMHAQEGFGLQALKEGKVDEAEKRLVESWRLSVEPTCLGKALIEHYRSIGNEELARAIFERFSNQLKTATEQVPGDETLIERLAEWRKMTGF